jgi:peroxiredoxin Q/BCP
MSTAQDEIVVGQNAPDFTLESSAGKISLSGYHDKQHVILYFMREFACSACQHHAKDLAKSYTELQAAGATVLVIGGGSLKHAQRLAERLSLPFPVLADPEHRVYRAYHLSKALLLFQTSATLLVDKSGIVRYVHRAANPYASLDNAELRRELAKLNANSAPAPVS